MTSIAGFAEMLDGGYAGELDTRAREYVLAILEAVRRLGVQIDQVLSIAEQDAGIQHSHGIIELAPILRSLAEKHGLLHTIPDDLAGAAASIDTISQPVELVITSIGGGAKQLAVTTGNGIRVAIAGDRGGTLPGDDVLIELRALMAERGGAVAVARRAGNVPVVTLSFAR